jgi:FkbM family methyltransferase
MDYKELERQIFILGRSFRLVGAKGDSYFESHIDRNGLAERDIVNILTASISEDDWTLDVGANIGYISLAMSVLCPKGKIFSFEPAKTTYKLLKKNTVINKVNNIVVNNIGLSDSKKSATLSASTTNSSGAFVNENVVHADMSGLKNDTIQLNRLDEEYERLGITKCSLIKVDIEGHEPNFLRGASSFIKKFKPQVLMEVNHWCLNVFNRMSLPEFIELSYKSFPYIFAFHEGDYLDLNDKNIRYKFYYENVVNNKYMNVYCGFDQNLMLSRLNSAFGGYEKIGYLLDEKLKLESQVHDLEKQLLDEKLKLESQVHDLEKQITSLRNSRPQKAAQQINKLLGR